MSKYLYDQYSANKDLDKQCNDRKLNIAKLSSISCALTIICILVIVMFSFGPFKAKDTANYVTFGFVLCCLCSLCMLVVSIFMDDNTKGSMDKAGKSSDFKPKWTLFGSMGIGDGMGFLEYGVTIVTVLVIGVAIMHLVKSAKDNKDSTLNQMTERLNKSNTESP